jgi:putative spermidine/putrescine transport system ATP-binding protein
VQLDCGPTAAVHVPAGRCTTTHHVGDSVVVAWNADDVPIVTQA